jgi:hypothetical protein
MTTLSLDRVAPGRYALGELGSLKNERRFAAVIEAGGEAWSLKRAAFGFGQTIVATGAADGSAKARYVPRGFLHLRGIYGGELKIGERALGWRANRQLGRRFTLSEGGETIASFEAGSAVTPVRLELTEPGRLAPLELLLCCHIVKQAVDTAVAGASAGASTGR